MKRKYEVVATQQMVRDYSSAKLRLREVATMLGVCNSYALLALRRAGYVMRKRGAPLRFKEISQDLIEEYKNGRISSREIAKEMGCSPCTVTRLLAVKYGFKSNFIKFNSKPKVDFRALKRRKSIVESFLSGEATQTICKRYGISKQRVFQIVGEQAPNRKLSNGMYLINCCRCNSSLIAVSRGRGKAMCPSCVEEFKKENISDL